MTAFIRAASCFALTGLVIGADLESAQNVLFLVARRQHDDRRLRLVTDAAADFETVDLGQVAIQEHDVRVFRLPALKRLLSIDGSEYVVTFAPQRVGHQIQ
jgi:hypothetical protein